MILRNGRNFKGGVIGLLWGVLFWGFGKMLIMWFVFILMVMLRNRYLFIISEGCNIFLFLGNGGSGLGKL